jgi:hypothetical protein
MGHPGHVLHQRGQHVLPASQVRREIERIKKMVIHIALGRPPADKDTVAPEKVAAVRREPDRQLQTVGIVEGKGPPEKPHLVVRRRGLFGCRGTVGAFTGPDPGSGVDERNVRHGENGDQRGAAGTKVKS